MINLKVLECSKDTRLYGYLTRLEQLTIYKSKYIKSIPKSLTNLKKLTIDGNIKIPDTLVNLEELKVERYIKNIPKIANLKSLTLISSNTKIPSELINLEKLNIRFSYYGNEFHIKNQNILIFQIQ